jgi:hypothetical protein
MANAKDSHLPAWLPVSGYALVVIITVFSMRPWAQTDPWTARDHANVTVVNSFATDVQFRWESVVCTGCDLHAPEKDAGRNCPPVTAHAAWSPCASAWRDDGLCPPGTRCHVQVGPPARRAAALANHTAVPRAGAEQPAGAAADAREGRRVAT